jgi:RHS repeat-associated protein
MLMPGRTYSATNGYRYGFNGKENDDDVKIDANGNEIQGSQQDYGMRIYDPRVGRFLSVDPISKEYPWYTPYQFSGNNPILFIDADGLEPATPKQKANAREMVNAYAIKNHTIRSFLNITKQGIVDDLKRQLNSPEKSVIPEGSGWYCGLYAFAYAYTYFDPEGFAKGVLNLIQNGKTTTSGGKSISASEALRTMDLNSTSINNNLSAFIFAAAIKEQDNWILNASTGRPGVWGSTTSGSMINMLKMVNVNVKEFAYGHERIGDGITNEDLGTMKKHIDNGNLAMLRISSNAWHHKQPATGENFQGFLIDGGDHWVVLSGIVNYDTEKNSITFSAYDNHGGTVNKTMKLSQFRAMIFHVLLLERKEEKKE